MEWQDISTAPKDGTEILVYGVFDCDHVPIIRQCMWVGSEWEGYRFACVGAQFDYDIAEKPTHWMPLPNPPKESQQQ